MKIALKSVSLLTLFLTLQVLITGLAHSQTYISPVLGYEKVRITADIYGTDTYIINSEKYVNNSILAGILIEQEFNPVFSLVMEGYYTQKEQITVYTTWGGQPINQIEFEMINLSLMSKLNIFPYLYCGIGVNTNIRYDQDFYAEMNRKFYDMGLKFNLGAVYKNFFINASYVRSIKQYDQQRNAFIEFGPINFFNVTIGYRIKILPLENKYKVQCPDIPR